MSWFNPFLVPKVYSMLRTRQYYSDGTLRYKDKHGYSQVQYYAQPYSKGFLEAEYELLEVANIGDLVLPKHFVFTRYTPMPAGRSTNDLVRMCVYSVQ